MNRLRSETTNDPIIDAGLMAVAELIRISDLDAVCGHRESEKLLGAEKDILHCLAGLVSVGKVGFDYIRQFQQDDFFATALSIDRVPSEATLRQRFEAISQNRKESSDGLIALTKQEGRAHAPRVGKTVYTRRTISGTCEQYSAELKSELGLERLLSGQFAVNELFVQLGVFVSDMPRVLGAALLNSEQLDIKRATRRRLRTEVRGMMYLCGRLVSHARRLVLKVASSGGYGEVRMGLHRKLATIEDGERWTWACGVLRLKNAQFRPKA